jgi:hypothetical protein
VTLADIEADRHYMIRLNLALFHDTVDQHSWEFKLFVHFPGASARTLQRHRYPGRLGRPNLCA